MFAILPTAEREGYIYMLEKEWGCIPPLCCGGLAERGEAQAVRLDEREHSERDCAVAGIAGY